MTNKPMNNREEAQQAFSQHLSQAFEANRWLAVVAYVKDGRLFVERTCWDFPTDDSPRALTQMVDLVKNLTPDVPEHGPLRVAEFVSEVQTKRKDRDSDVLVNPPSGSPESKPEFQHHHPTLQTHETPHESPRHTDSLPHEFSHQEPRRPEVMEYPDLFDSNPPKDPTPPPSSEELTQPLGAKIVKPDEPA